MSDERVSPSTETAPGLASPAGGHDGAGRAAPPPLRLQILATEHWSLLASRALAWNEAFSRAGMFLSTLSGAMVALALVAQASAFGSAFVLFALVILPVVLFVGGTTYLRLDASNHHDAQCVVGMNRLRGAYLELAPELERCFVMSAHDDVRGLGVTMGLRPGAGTLPQLLAATPTVVGVLNSVLVGVIAALLTLQLAAGPAAALVGVGVVGFLVSMAAHGWYARRSIRRAQRGLRPLFPTPEGAH